MFLFPVGGGAKSLTTGRELKNFRTGGRVISLGGGTFAAGKGG